MHTENQRHPKKEGKHPPFAKQEQSHPGSGQEMTPQADHGEQSYKGFGRLKDKVALITGGDSGIGRAVAIAFAREGADVVFSYLSEAEEEDAQETVKWVEKAGRKALAVACDLADPEQCRQLVDQTVGKFSRIGVLVNNAAYQGPSVQSIEELTAERVRHTFAVNIEAMFTITQHALPHMNEGSTIITSSSIQAFEPAPSILDYATTKAAIYNFTKGLSKELLDKGIRVNSVAPGPVWTPLIAQSFDADKVGSFGEGNPMGRPAQPAEMAPAYVFLACDESRFITGEVIGATGGKRLA